MNDVVNNPSHYCSAKYECIDIMLETQGIDAVLNFCLCNAFKYLYRHKKKNGIEDIKKCKWYLDKYIELFENKQNGVAEDIKAKKIKSQSLEEFWKEYKEDGCK